MHTEKNLIIQFLVAESVCWEFEIEFKLRINHGNLSVCSAARAPHIPRVPNNTTRVPGCFVLLVCDTIRLYLCAI